MRRIALLFAVLAFMTSPALAQMDGCPYQGKSLKPVAFETVTVSATAVGLTSATVTTTNASAAFVTMEGTSALRYLVVGTPTTTVGHLIDPPASGNNQPSRGLWICGKASLLGLRMIRTASPDLTIQVTYYSPP